MIKNRDAESRLLRRYVLGLITLCIGAFGYKHYYLAMKCEAVVIQCKSEAAHIASLATSTMSQSDLDKEKQTIQTFAERAG